MQRYKKKRSNPKNLYKNLDYNPKNYYENLDYHIFLTTNYIILTNNDTEKRVI